MAENGKHPYNEAARRLKAALLSFHLGRAGVDSTLKEVAEDAGEHWAMIAAVLLREMENEVGKTFTRISAGSDKIQ